jgi:hypothetical protein
MAASLWALATSELAAARILPGPRRPSDVAAMVATSVALPPSAVWHRLLGEVRALAVSRGPEPVDGEVAWRSAHEPVAGESRPRSAGARPAQARPTVPTAG